MMCRRRIAVVGLCLLLFLAWRTVAVAGEEEVNNGQDITRPLTRFDIRYEYQNAPGSRNDNMNVTTLRVDKPFPLMPRWEFASRIDLP